MSHEIDYASVLADLEARRAALDASIAGIRVILGQGAPDGVAPTEGYRPASLGQGDSREIPPGTFHGMSVTEAARRFLEIRKQKQRNTEVAAALRNGGIESTSKNFPGMLYTTLSRNKGFIRMGDYWALAEWHPTRQAPATSKPKKKGKKGKKAKSAKQAAAKSATAEKPSDVKASAPTVETVKKPSKRKDANASEASA